MGRGAGPRGPLPSQAGVVRFAAMPEHFVTWGLIVPGIVEFAMTHRVSQECSRRPAPQRKPPFQGDREEGGQEACLAA